MNKLTKKTVAIYLSAIFAAGLVAGGVAGFTVARKRVLGPPLRQQDIASQMFERLQSRLQLTPEQRKKIEPFVKEAAAELQSTHAATGERIEEILQRLDRCQEQFLQPEQKKLLEEWERERQQLFQKAFKGQSGPSNKPGPLPQQDR